MTTKFPLGIIAMTLASAMLLSGCTERIGDFTLISTKNVEIGGKYKKLDTRYKGEDGRGILLGIPLGMPNLKTAVDNCIEAGTGELLTNAVVESSFWWAIIWGEQKYIVTGDVWTKASSSDLRDIPDQLYNLEGSASGYHLVSASDPVERVKVDYFCSSR